ncbi:UDP-glucuronosyltransferase 1A1-like [Haliotis asinina]|uniref:UDP-glucuronosyltransferase 1A1-like n=1 Tax=Haliotis asinina TaxID=109174 RepID=UPI0035323765
MLLSTFVFLTTFVSCCHGAKVLLIPTPATSHCLEIMSIGQALLKRGHDVTLFAVLSDHRSCIGRLDKEAFKEKFTVIVPKVDPTMQKTHDDMMAAAGGIIFNREYMWKMVMNFMRPMIQNHCRAAMEDRVVLERLKKDNYDVALIARMPGSECLFAIGAYLGVPTVAVFSYLDNTDTGMPLQSNTFPHLMSSFTNDMTFPERLLNTLSFFLTPIVFKVFEQSIDYSVLDEKMEGVDGRDLVKKSLLFIENSDYIIDYPKAVFPNFVQCGGLTASPANPLSAEMKKYMDAATDGVVLVTFGSMIKGFPTSLIEKLMSAFGRLKYSVLFKQDKEGIRGNIKSMKWVPQNDILGHPNTKVFISHCGKNGFWEAVYHGVPIICMPIHAETFTTAIKVKKYNIGSRIEIFDDSVDDLFEKISQVLESTAIRQNMKRMSRLLRDRPERPADRAASAVEHVLKYGGDHMRPPPVSFVSYIYADVWATIAVPVSVITTAVVWICRRCCCKGKANSKRKTE